MAALVAVVALLATSCIAPAPESGASESGATASSATASSATASGRSASGPGALVGGAMVGGAPAVVERVVDGDTIVVTIQNQTETVRLLGIDTPEKSGGPRPAECFGAQASSYVAELLPPGTAVLLSRDRETRDQYSRLLAYVHRSSDGLFINQSMLEGGYATPLFFAPNTSLRPAFERAANQARRQWIGFWPACGAADIAITS